MMPRNVLASAIVAAGLATAPARSALPPSMSATLREARNREATALTALGSRESKGSPGVFILLASHSAS